MTLPSSRRQRFLVGGVGCLLLVSLGGCANTAGRDALDEISHHVATTTPVVGQRLSEEMRRAHVTLAPSPPGLKRRKVSTSAWWGHAGYWAQHARDILQRRLDALDDDERGRVTAFSVWTLGDDVVAVAAQTDADAPVAFAAALVVQDKVRFFDDVGKPLGPRFIRRPVRGAVTSGFGPRVDPFTGRRGAFHRGLDIAARRGAPVRSMGDGVVTMAKPWGVGGLTVKVEHAEGWSSAYGHLDRIDVRVGQTVTAGQRLGIVGNTGKSTGPHLHFEVRKDYVLVDPAKVGWPALKRLRGKQLRQHRRRIARLKTMHVDDAPLLVDDSWPFPGWTPRVAPAVTQVADSQLHSKR